MLSFRPALFQPAVERNLPIVPAAVCYSSRAAAFVGETTFMGSLVAICSARGLELRLTILPPLARGLTRREAARQARLAIVQALGAVGFADAGAALDRGFRPRCA